MWICCLGLILLFNRGVLLFYRCRGKAWMCDTEWKHRDSRIEGLSETTLSACTFLRNADMYPLVVLWHLEDKWLVCLDDKTALWRNTLTLIVLEEKTMKAKYNIDEFKPAWSDFFIVKASFDRCYSNLSSSSFKFFLVMCRQMDRITRHWSLYVGPALTCLFTLCKTLRKMSTSFWVIRNS